MKESLKKKRDIGASYEGIYMPHQSLMFYSKQRFEHVSDDESVLHKLLWLQLWLHGWNKIKTTKFGDSGMLAVLHAGRCQIGRNLWTKIQGYTADRSPVLCDFSWGDPRETNGDILGNSSASSGFRETVSQFTGVTQRREHGCKDPSIHQKAHSVKTGTDDTLQKPHPWGFLYN